MKWALGFLAAGLILASTAGGSGGGRSVFPGLAVALGIWVYVRKQQYFLDYAIWLWFLTPFLRRLLDLNAGWLDPSPILLVPYLVTLIAPLADFRRIVRAPLSTTLPY